TSSAQPLPFAEDLVTWYELCRRVSNGTFFDYLTSIRNDRDKLNSCLKWLPLLQTSGIQEWAQNSKVVQHACGHVGPRWFPVLSLLLERHLLSLNTRHNSARFIDFWRWATTNCSEFTDLWNPNDLSDTLTAETIPAQEVLFGKLLANKAQSLDGFEGVAWAARTLKNL